MKKSTRFEITLILSGRVVLTRLLHAAVHRGSSAPLLQRNDHVRMLRFELMIIEEDGGGRVMLTCNATSALPSGESSGCTRILNRV